MAITQSRPKRSVTGARYIDYRKKKQYEKGSVPAMTKLGESVKRLRRTLGGNCKSFLLATDVANVFDKKSNKHIKAKILGIVENSANRHYVRRNIMTRGAIIETDKGRARVTSRPGQEGAVNAELV